MGKGPCGSARRSNRRRARLSQSEAVSPSRLRQVFEGSYLRIELSQEKLTPHSFATPLLGGSNRDQETGRRAAGGPSLLSLPWLSASTSSARNAGTTLGAPLRTALADARGACYGAYGCFLGECFPCYANSRHL